MSEDVNFDAIRDYFDQKIRSHGSSPAGVDWNSVPSQEVRFAQLVKILESGPAGRGEGFSLIDWGCGYGALIDYLERKGHRFTYVGYDLLESMVTAARQTYQGRSYCTFTAQESELAEADYTVSSGIFNKKFAPSDEAWLAYILHTLERFNALSRKGFAFNMLTSYSDREYMRPDLYYANPLYIFDYCKTHFSRNVALLHDYEIYDFTILVRKAT